MERYVPSFLRRMVRERTRSQINTKLLDGSKLSKKSCTIIVGVFNHVCVKKTNEFDI
jgi:hypothetical protein